MARLIAVVLCALLVAPSAYAEDAPPPPEMWAPWLQPPPPEPVKDMRLPMGVTLLVTGGLLVAGGAALFVDAEDSQSTEPPRPCTPQGCAPVTVVQEDAWSQAPAVGMLSGGIGTALVGMGVLGNHIAEAEPFPHKGAGRVGAGILLTGLGAGTTVGGAAIVGHAAAVRDEDTLIVGIVMFVPAAGLLATGVPLWITGSRPPDELADQRPSKKEVYRSPTMATVGVGLMVVGAGTIATGAALAVDLENEAFEVDEFGGTSFRAPDASVVGLTMAAAGITLVSLGIPLTVIGLGTVPANQAHASVGPGRVSVDVRF